MIARPISTLQHAVVDYAWSTVVSTLPRWFGWDRQATAVCDSVATLSVAQSTLTDYEGGLLRVMPMQAHLAMDAVVGLGLIGAAALEHRQPPAVRFTLLGAGLFALAATVLTDPIPRSGTSRTHARRTAARVNLIAGERVAALAGRR